MQVFEHFLPSKKPLSVALGTFDGVHTAHQRVIRQAAIEEEKGMVPAVLTFQKNPLNDITGQPVPELMSERLKQETLAALGIDLLFCVPFSNIRNLSPEEFVCDVLRDALGAKKVCCGFNFHFGSNGSGTAEMLSALCRTHGITADISEPVYDSGGLVSSSRIRQLLGEGDTETSMRLLGRPFTIDFLVAAGNRIGRSLGFPTINQPFPQGFIIPRFGVYASKTLINGKWLTSVTNIGVKPTVGSYEPLAETCVLDYEGELYGQRIQVGLYKFIRPETRFENLDMLREAVRKDKTAAQNYFYQNSCTTSQI